jgi:lipopolysaccharide biosynthesis glycosyltransferase
MCDVLEAVRVVAVHVEGYVPMETYNKIFLAELMQGFGKILYIDTDLIVNEDIAKLLDTDLGGKAIGASLNVANIHAAAVDKTV